MFKTKFTKLFILLVMIAAGVTGYYLTKNKAGANAPQGQAQQQAAMPVQVVIVERKPVQIWNDYSARLEPVNYAEIRPQVSGTIKQIKFEDGQDVKKGDILFIIDPRVYRAAANQAQAEVDAADNQYILTQKELERAQELIKSDAISKRILDERQSAMDVAKANILSARARLNQAKIDLDFAYLKAPISGRVSRAEILEGNLVEAGPNAPVLTSIVSIDDIYADFEVDEQTYLTYIRTTAKDKSAERNVPVKLSLAGDQIEYQGFIHSFDNQIDSDSGTIRARALFKNEDGGLLPGMFASVKMGSPTMLEEILITEKAISTDQDRKFVYVVDEENKVAYRPVKIGESMDGKRVITSGLKEGEKVITEGIIRLRPGMPVDPQVEQQTQELLAVTTEENE